MPIVPRLLRRGLLIAALASPLAVAATPPVPAFTAHYTVLRNGSAIGQATLTLAPAADGSWTFSTVTRGTAGMAGLLGAASREVSVFRWAGQLPQCLRYDYSLDAGFKKKHRMVRCNWTQGSIVVDDNGPHTFATQPGALERHTVPLALAAGLAAGQQSFDLPVAVRDRIQIQHYVAQARQTLRVPAGNFDAVRVTRTDNDQGLEAWFAPGQVPVPVKIDQRGKDHLALELESWKTTASP